MSKPELNSIDKSIQPGSYNKRFPDENFAQATTSTLSIGTPWSIESRIAKYGRDNLQGRSIKRLALQMQVNNLSSSSSDYFKFISIFHLLSKFDVYINNVLIYQLPSSDFNLGAVYLRNLYDNNQTITQVDLDHYVQRGQTTGLTATVAATNLYDSMKIAGGSNSGIVEFDLKWIIPLFERHLPGGHIDTLRIDSQIDGLKAGIFNHRMQYDDTHGTTTGISNHLQITKFQLHIEFDSMAYPLKVPNPLCLLSKTYQQKTYYQPFASSTTFTVDLYKDFSQFNRLRRVYFWLYNTGDTATTSSKSYEYSNDKLFTSMQLRRDGIQILNYVNLQEWFNHMLVKKQALARNVHYPPNITTLPYMMYYDFVEIDEVNTLICNGQNDKIHYLGGINNKAMVFEFVLNVASTNTYDLIVIPEADLVPCLETDTGKVFIMDRLT